MIIVLDASAGIEIALDREKAKIFEAQLLNASKIITSDLYKAETANVIWKYVKANLLPKEDAMQIYGNCENIIDEFVDISENAEEAISESIRLNHSTYDLLYFIGSSPFQGRYKHSNQDLLAFALCFGGPKNSSRSTVNGGDSGSMQVSILRSRCSTSL